MGQRNKNYCKDNKICVELIDGIIEYTERLGFKVIEKEKALPITYWTPKMCKNPTCPRFIISSKICSTGQNLIFAFNILKFIYLQIENIHKNVIFLSCYKKVRILKNSDLPIKSLYNILRRRFKAITTYPLSTSYRKLLLEKLKSKNLSIFDFTFKGEGKTFIKFSNNGTIYWGKKIETGLMFSKTSLKIAIDHLMEN